MTTMLPSALAKLIEAPASDSQREYETLGYVEAYDAVLNADYAYVAYKETDRACGSWSIRIKSKGTAGAVLDPIALRLRAREAGARSQPYFTWGYSFTPSVGDPRQIEFRIHVADALPSAVEMLVRLRKADHTADEPKSVTFAWPRT